MGSMELFRSRKGSKSRQFEHPVKEDENHTTGAQEARWNALARKVRQLESAQATLEDRVSALRRDVNRIDKRDYRELETNSAKRQERPRNSGQAPFTLPDPFNFH